MNYIRVMENKYEYSILATLFIALNLIDVMLTKAVLATGNGFEVFFWGMSYNSSYLLRLLLPSLVVILIYLTKYKGLIKPICKGMTVVVVVNMITLFVTQVVM